MGTELRFRAVSYQALVAALGPGQDREEIEYLEYIRDRYGLGGATAHPSG